MGREVSIVISAKDDVTQNITTMRNSMNSFNKDLTGTKQKLDELNKNKHVIKVEADKALSELKAAQKQFAATGDAADKMAVEIAGANYDNINQNLDLVSRNAKQAYKDILSMTDAVSKADNRAGGGIGQSSGTLKSLAQAGLTKMVGDTVSAVAQTVVSSALGSDAGTIFGNTLSGAATGAAMGSLAGPMGTAVGAVAGGITGIVNGAVQVFQNQDDAFKSAVQTVTNDVTQPEKDALSRGTTIAGTREQNQISFSTLLGGDSKAKDFLSSLLKFGNETPFEYDDLTTTSRTMLAYGYKQNEIIPELTKIGDAGSALGMSPEDMNYVATSLGRMKTTGKTTLEYLNPLLERGIPVWDYLAKASGKTKEEVQEMVSKGLVPGAEAAKAISDYMGKNFSGNMQKQSQTFQGLTSSLEDAQSNLDAAMGKGYEDVRKPGIQKQIDYMNGEGGAKMQEAYTMIGKYQASLENTHEQEVRDAMDDAMETDAYKTAKLKGDGAEAGRIVEKARADAEAKYRETDEFEQQQASQIKLVNDVQKALSPVYQTFGYTMGQEFSKGLAAATAESVEKTLKDALSTGGSGNSTITGSPTIGSGGSTSKKEIISATETPGGTIKPNFHGTEKAIGMFRVPYDNFPALLHEGETVNTAVEARSAKNKPNIQVTVNGLTVREEADIDKIASAFVEKIQKASFIS